MTVHRALTEEAAAAEANNHLLAHLCETDALTNVGNRRAQQAAFDAWRAWLARADAATEARATLLLVDADHFKRVNDTWGHAEGDRVLVALAHSLQASVRATDHISRFGGEKFVVWLHLADQAVYRAKARGRNQTVITTAD